jgi:integrase
VKGSVYLRGTTWTYRFLSPERDSATGSYPTISKGGFPTEKEAWKACREAMRETDRGRVVKPSIRTVEQCFLEWLAEIEPTIDATTWQNWKDYAHAYVIPRIGGARLQGLNEPELLKLYGKLLAEGRVKPDRNADMYAFWHSQVTEGNDPTPRAVAAACETTIHAARSAVRRYKAGIVPKQTSLGLAPKTVRNIHAMLHRALVDAVAWKYITDNPASNVKPPKRPRTRRQVWRPDQIQSFLASVRQDRFASLFLLELSTGIRRGQVCGLRWASVDLDAGEIAVHDNRVVVAGRAGQGRRQDQERRPDDRHRPRDGRRATRLEVRPGPRARGLW